MFLQRLLTHPGERRDVEYKSSSGFEGDNSFSLKLVRHIQGMANAGGGWLVIGFAETDDQGLVPDPSHTEAICSSYDPTALSQRVDSSVARGQRLPLTVHFDSHPVTDLRYPIVQIDGFVRIPFVCRGNRSASDTGEEILRQGKIYIRRPGAETAPVSTPGDWEDLINRCVRLRRSEFLEEFRDLFERMTSTSPPPSAAPAELSQWMGTMRGRAMEDSGEAGAE